MFTSRLKGENKVDYLPRGDLIQCLDLRSIMSLCVYGGLVRKRKLIPEFRLLNYSRGVHLKTGIFKILPYIKPHICNLIAI